MTESWHDLTCCQLTLRRRAALCVVPDFVHAHDFLNQCGYMQPESSSGLVSQSHLYSSPHRHVSMQNLPTETLFQIFQTACTDGGLTGCSLSQTSRAIRAASQPARFYSIALSMRLRQLEPFIALYQQLCVLGDETRAKVIHLHLADEDEGFMPYSRHDFEAPSYPQAVRLLHLVADDLVSLVLPSTLLMPPPSGDLQLADRSFSSLSALIVNVPNDQDTSALVTSAVSPLFPNLTHAHIVMPRLSHIYAPTRGAWEARAPKITAWEIHAPNVTHLRISFCPLSGMKLRYLLGTPSYPMRHGPLRPPPTTRAWPSVRHVAIQPIPEPDASMPPRVAGKLYWWSRSRLSWMVNWANNEENQRVLESARILEQKPTGLTRSSREWRVAVRATWERLVTSGIESDWLTWGEVDEPTDSDSEE